MHVIYMNCSCSDVPFHSLAYIYAHKIWTYKGMYIVVVECVYEGESYLSGNISMQLSTAIFILFFI